MQKITFTNAASETFELGYTKPWVLGNLVGISDSPVDVLSVRGYQQDGQTAKGQFFQARSITFSVVIFGDTAAEVFERRRTLVKFLNPKDSFTAVYENSYASYKFACRISTQTSFPTTELVESLPQTCTVSVICDDPYFYDVTETTVDMSIEDEAFYFPLVFPKTEDIIFSSITSKQVTITNTGDVPTPVRIAFHGGATNPIVTNETTGEYIKVTKVIAADEVLEINTAYGNKTVELVVGTTRTNAFQYIDLGSTFFDLEVGTNVLSYDADSGADSAQLYVYYSNKYVGA